jgi:hypothetical protein
MECQTVVAGKSTVHQETHVRCHGKVPVPPVYRVWLAKIREPSARPQRNSVQLAPRANEHSTGSPMFQSKTEGPSSRLAGHYIEVTALHHASDEPSTQVVALSPRQHCRVLAREGRIVRPPEEKTEGPDATVRSPCGVVLEGSTSPRSPTPDQKRGGLAAALSYSVTVSPSLKPPQSSTVQQSGRAPARQSTIVLDSRPRELKFSRTSGEDASCSTTEGTTAYMPGPQAYVGCVRNT